MRPALPILFANSQMHNPSSYLELDLGALSHIVELIYHVFWCRNRRFYRNGRALLEILFSRLQFRLKYTRSFIRTTCMLHDSQLALITQGAQKLDELRQLIVSNHATLLLYPLNEVTWVHQMTAERIVSGALLKHVNRKDAPY
ncbi:hypothetical protein GGI43DRAFT_298966 [Trichoderma evansii]